MKRKGERVPRPSSAASTSRPAASRGGRTGQGAETFGRFLSNLARLEAGPKLGKGGKGGR